MHPGPGAPPEEVARSQRRRLNGAMVAVCAEMGYESTRVSDLIEVAGVSSATFYRFFANKEECFLATLERIIEAGLNAPAASIEREGTWEGRARKAIEALTELIVSQPAAARMCMVESHAVGPRATEKLDTALSGFEQLMGYVFENLPGRGRMPPEVIAALIGGMRKMIHSRLHRHSEKELSYVLPEALDLWLSYRPPPKPLRYRGRKPATVEDRAGGRAEDDTVARIERAALATVADSGYAETSLADIAAEAAVSLSTFYTHFDGKESALDSALNSARLGLTASAMPAFEQSPTWPDGVRAGIEMGFAFFESEPDFARVASCDIYGAGPMALEQLDQSIEALQPLLDGGFELAGHVQPLAREAIPSAVYAMLCNRIQTRGTEGLRELAPLGTYLLLAPFVGPDDAVASANSAALREPDPSRPSRHMAAGSSR